MMFVNGTHNNKLAFITIIGLIFGTYHIYSKYQSKKNNIQNETDDESNDEKDFDEILAHGMSIPKRFIEKIPKKEADLLRFLLKYLSDRNLPIDGILINGGYVRDLLLGDAPDDLDLTLCLADCDHKITIQWILNDLDAYVKESNLCNDYGILSLKIFDIQSDVTKDKQLDTAKTMFYLDDGTSVEVDLMPTIGEEIYDDADNRIPVRDHRGTPEQDALRRDITIGSMFVKVTWGSGTKNDQVEYILLDYFGGLQDLRDGILRAPSPRKYTHEVMSEEDRALEIACGIEHSNMHQVWWVKILRDDPLRVLRVFRFSAKLNFTIHDDFWKVIPFALENLKCRVAGSRKLTEILKVAKYGECKTLNFFVLCFAKRFVTSKDGTMHCLAPGIFGGKDAQNIAHYIPYVVDFDESLFEAIVISSVPSSLSCPEMVGCCLALAIFCTTFDTDVSALDMFQVSCNGLCASKEMRDAGSRLLIAYNALSGTRASEPMDLLFGQRLKRHSKDAFGSLLQVWEALQLAKNLEHYSHEIIIAMLQYHPEKQSFVSSALTEFRASQVQLLSGKVLNGINTIPVHLRATMISRLDVLMRSNDVVTQITDSKTLLMILDSECDHLLNDLEKEWYSESGELKEFYQKKILKNNIKRGNGK